MGQIASGINSLIRDRSRGDNLAESRVGFALAEEDGPIQRAAQFDESDRERAWSCRVRNGCGSARKRLQRQVVCKLYAFHGVFVLSVWTPSASCQRNCPSSFEEVDITPTSLSALRCAVRQNMSFAFAVSVSGYCVCQRRRDPICAHERTTLRAPLPKAMTCCRVVRNAFGFALTRFDGPRKSKQCIDK
jgi:hypothetical protein